MNPDDSLTKFNSSTAGTPQSASESLVAELNALHHELRRVRDSLERVGGSSHDLEKTAQQLSKNIELCESDLEKHRSGEASSTDQADLFGDEG